MKKMIVIAALIGGMLMPAQIMAQNNRKNEKPRVENRDKRKDMRPGKNNRPGLAMNKPAKPGKPKYYKPAPPPPPPVIRRAPRPCPPVVVHRDCCDNDGIGTAVAAIGLAALIAIAAN